MDSKNNLIVGLGEVLWDVLPEGRKLGGAPANFAYNVRQFGFDSLAISAVGNDKLGDETLAALKNKGLDFIMPQVPYPTGTVLVSLDDEGIPASLYARDEGCRPKLPRSLLGVARPAQRGVADYHQPLSRCHARRWRSAEGV